MSVVEVRRIEVESEVGIPRAEHEQLRRPWGEIFRDPDEAGTEQY